MDFEEWKKLGFDPKKDGRWATVDSIKQRIQEKKIEARKKRILAVFVALGAIIVFGFILWIFI
jgi:hypothetical protein|tara:strand:+ start:2520 stop:2708 length:189 start_codon:yes stop_codon:yes gene_type:complete